MSYYNAKPIVALKCDGSVAGYFDSAMELQRRYRYSNSWVSKAIREKKLFRGFMWMWADEYKKYLDEGRVSELAYTLPPGLHHGDKVKPKNKPHNISPEGREVMRQKARALGMSWKGKRRYDKAKCVAIRTKDGEENYFRSLRDAVEFVGCSQGCLSYAISHRVGLKKKQFFPRFISHEQYEKLVKLKNAKKPRKK